MREAAFPSSPQRGGGGLRPQGVVEGATAAGRPIRQIQRTALAPSTMLRMVPLPRCAGRKR